MSNWARKYFGLYIDGRDKVGDVIDYTAPVLEVQTEDFRAGGMDMATPMDMGMAPMEAGWSMGEDPEVLALFGIKKDGKKIAVFVRSAIEDDETGRVRPVVEELRGKLTKVDPGTKSGGAFNANSYTMKLSYYRYEVNDEIIHEIDPPNLVRVINGVDQLAEYRRALGK
ncbi:MULTISPECIES: phage major tail tube protein [unclassified Vibrio]|uniref:phage major tail tube protein n=1 Tax=unclassified Vibrio TaxID=2614977 RepID=UPI001360C2BC|nr:MULTISPECIES: phage major tail tube protein [unclassified Vibrio]NAW56620.1 phage major tail tube protein [Vibrio sp. V36_P2S2PM302]NAX27329.1 phage major tail tube protein [Vibrio sp. V38_P2S17PM301]NAX29030.1 phage major tail tube protein [Vibrio sp. V37_P2S8PM304]